MKQPGLDGQMQRGVMLRDCRGGPMELYGRCKRAALAAAPRLAKLKVGGGGGDGVKARFTFSYICWL